MSDQLSFKKATRQGVKPLKKPKIAGAKNPNWIGGQIVTKDGRVMIHSPLHPFPSKGRYVYRYRLVMEEHLGRYLDRSEVVHHVNGQKDDDRIENLQLLGNTEHSLLHGAIMSSVWARNYSQCVQCGSSDAPHKGHGLCTRCTDKKRWPFRKNK